MKKIKRLMSLVLTLLLIVGMWHPISAIAADQSKFNMGAVAGKTVVIHTNDTHGRIQFGKDGSVGFVSIAAFKKACIAAGANVILLDAGDTLHGKPIATIDKGDTIVSLMNAVGYDAMTSGNHDYNYGSARLLELSKKMNFPVLASNVRDKETGKNFLGNHMIIEKNGMKFGIFGLGTQETATKTNPLNVTNLTFEDPIKTAKEEVAALKEAGANYIIALGHIGIDQSSKPTSVDILKAVEGIDLFVDGHSHSTLDKDFAANVGNKGLLVSDGQYMNTIGVVVIDRDKTSTAYSVNLEDLKAAGLKTELAKDANGATIENETAIDKAVGDIMISAATKLDKALGQVVTKTDVYLDGVRENVRTKETNLGNLAADAIRWASKADVAFTNGGGIRASIEAGDVTKGMLAEVFPFGNIVVTKRVRGSVIKAILEHGVKDYPALSGGFPQTSGLTFTLDVTKEAGNRISDIKVNGKKINMNAWYTLASNDFTIAGGDGYDMISDAVYPKLMEYGALDEVLISYMQTKPKASSFAVGRTKFIDANTVVEEEPEVEEEVKVPQKPEKEQKPTSEKSYYVVVKGDNLSKISKKFFGTEKNWKMVYKWNKDTIKDPSILYIGQKLIIDAK